MKEIAKDVYQIAVMPRDSINCYLVDNILIDSGIRNSHKIILNALKDKYLHAHALTHAHADHQGSSKMVCTTLGIPLWSSALEKQNAETGDVTSDYHNQNNLITKFQKKYWAGPGHPISRTLKEGDPVGSFTVIETPGHSLGHISFFREQDGVLIVGDTLVNMNLITTLKGLHQPPNLFTTNQEQNRESIKKILQLKPKVLCFGHGPILINNGELERFYKKLRK
jgi:glyoxylase-like metal-dependent hydrolase (beta-lactamase superfamily II)